MMPELKLYTVANLREWLEYGNAKDGLSEQIIAPTRAWAIIHNPFVKEDDPIVSAIYEEEDVVAYTASFPEQINGERIWWASTLYCNPKFEGRGYGLIVMGALKEAHEPELTYDRWGARETVEICERLGMQTTHTLRYRLSDKSIEKNTICGKLAFFAQKIQQCIHPWPKLSRAEYTLRYTSYIDGEVYAFMRAHRGQNLWLREQKMFNWILRYPFRQGCPLMDKVERDTVFSANTPSCEFKVVKVYVKSILQGGYIISKTNEVLNLVYLYYSLGNKNAVYDSISDHIISIKPKEFVTEDDELMRFIQKKLYFPKIQEEKISFSVPANIKLPADFTLQLGDGDNFA